MVPPFVPFPAAMVYLSGVLELAGAAGLVLARTRRAAGFCLALLFVCLLPANIHGDLTPLWIRVPEQILYIAVALVSTRAVNRSSRNGGSPPAGQRPFPWRPSAEVGRVGSRAKP
jgi:uncharacterized membrane protein